MSELWFAELPCDELLFTDELPSSLFCAEETDAVEEDWWECTHAVNCAGVTTFTRKRIKEW